MRSLCAMLHWASQRTADLVRARGARARTGSARRCRWLVQAARRGDRLCCVTINKVCELQAAQRVTL